MRKIKDLGGRLAALAAGFSGSRQARIKRYRRDIDGAETQSEAYPMPTMPDQPRFTRRTVLAACDLIATHPAMATHAKFNGLILRLGAENLEITGRYLAEKANALKHYLVANPSARTPDDEFMVDVLIREAAKLPLSNQSECFTRALARDGFVVTDEGELRSMLPDMAALPRAQDEVHSLLEELCMDAMVHLNQALDNHARAQWEAANAALRTFMEGLFNEIAERLAPDRAASTPKGHPRRQLLADLEPPFLIEKCGEWSRGKEEGKNFVNGVFKRLHSDGSHAGLSDEDDCTFRLHLALVVARHFLRRARKRLGGE